MIKPSLYLRKRVSNALFPLPCVMDAQSFASLVRTRSKRLESVLKNQLLRSSPDLRSRAFEEEVTDKVKQQCAPLATLRQRDVEDAILDKYGLADQRIATCLVPFQLGANIILARLPPDIRRESIAELKAAEDNLGLTHAAMGTPQNNKWIEWYDRDLYVKDGIRYLSRIDARSKKRIPVFAAVGHMDHGKTTLLDALLYSVVAQSEPYGTTQTIRAFTASHPARPDDLFTFMDAPGDKLFVESRYHIQRIADCVLIVVSVPDGIQSQTHEAVKVALNLDKPVIVVLTKLDQLSDPLTAHQRTQKVLRELDEIGLQVLLIEKESDLGKSGRESARPSGASVHPSSSNSARQTTGVSAAVPATRGRNDAYLLPMKSMYPSYKGSSWRPVIDVRRKCYGVCVSSTRKVNLPLLWRLLCTLRDTLRPTCHSTSATPQEHDAAVQAVVLESSKHLFDEEGFRQNRVRQRLQRRLDSAEARVTAKRNAMSVRAKMNTSLTATQRHMQRHNRTSSSSLVITVVVREGALSRGTHFVADQAEGKVDHLFDYWGNSIERALPGMAVTVVDTNSTSGCPGVGIHLLSVTDETTRMSVFRYRQLLQWYVEVFTTKLHYLKPRGMDTQFAHLGDYGQLRVTWSLEYQLLYGPPPEPSPPAAQHALPTSAVGEAKVIAAGREDSLSKGSGEDTAKSPQEREDDEGSADHADLRNNDGVNTHPQSLGKYLAELNAIDDARIRANRSSVPLTTTSRSLSSTVVGLPALTSGLSAQSLRACETQLSAEPKRISQGLLDDNEETIVEQTWDGLQRHEPIKSQEEYDRHMQQCVQVGVLLKVDNWHTARMLYRQVSRMGTRKVAFHVVGVRFGPLTVEDVVFFGQTTKVVVCFRNPYTPSTDLDQYIELSDLWVLQTDHFADITTFMKWCAVAVHKQWNGEDGRASDKRLFVPSEQSPSQPLAELQGERGEHEVEDSGAGKKDGQRADDGVQSGAPRKPRKKKLLVYSGDAVDDRN